MDGVTALIQPDDFIWENSSEELRVCVSIEINSPANINQPHVLKIFNDLTEMVKEYLKVRKAL